ncbi:MAG: hypothetical protein Q8R00_01140 [Candidatus Nanoarchaeia archaeon]|nr:hypothetical protein [Candidatus Nanoarchaeia archaeon]
MKKRGPNAEHKSIAGVFIATFLILIAGFLSSQIYEPEPGIIPRVEGYSITGFATASTQTSTVILSDSCAGTTAYPIPVKIATSCPSGYNREVYMKGGVYIPNQQNPTQQSGYNYGQGADFCRESSLDYAKAYIDNHNQRVCPSGYSDAKKILTKATIPVEWLTICTKSLDGDAVIKVIDVTKRSSYGWGSNLVNFAITCPSGYSDAGIKEDTNNNFWKICYLEPKTATSVQTSTCSNLKGKLHTEPAKCDSTNEGIDTNVNGVDSGTMGICSDDTKVVLLYDQCATQKTLASSCPSGYTKLNEITVGYYTGNPLCDGKVRAEDENGKGISAGRVAICTKSDDKTILLQDESHPNVNPESCPSTHTLVGRMHFGDKDKPTIGGTIDFGGQKYTGSGWIGVCAKIPPVTGACTGSDCSISACQSANACTSANTNNNCAWDAFEKTGNKCKSAQNICNAFGVKLCDYKDFLKGDYSCLKKDQQGYYREACVGSGSVGFWNVIEVY